MNFERSRRWQGWFGTRPLRPCAAIINIFTPEHLLKVLLDDREGLAADRYSRCGSSARALSAVERDLGKLPKVEGSGAGQVYLSPELARVFANAEEIADKAGDSYVTAEAPVAGVGPGRGTPAAEAWPAPAPRHRR